MPEPAGACSYPHHPAAARLLAILMVVCCVSIPTWAWAGLESHVDGVRLTLPGCYLDLPSRDWGWQAEDIGHDNAVEYRTSHDGSEVLCIYGAVTGAKESLPDLMGRTIDKLLDELSKQGVVGPRPKLVPSKLPFPQGSYQFQGRFSTLNGQRLKVAGYTGVNQGYLLVLLGVLENADDGPQFEQLARSCRPIALAAPGLGSLPQNVKVLIAVVVGAAVVGLVRLCRRS